MARKRKPAIREKDLQGFKYFQYFKYFQKLLPLLDRLHDHRPPTTDHRPPARTGQVRFYQHILGCRHLLSHRPNGIEIQVYMAIIVCMLIALWTHRAPTLRTVEMIRFYFTGWATEEELVAHIAKLQAAGE
jgi:hypothetical protein